MWISRLPIFSRSPSLICVRVMLYSSVSTCHFASLRPHLQPKVLSCLQGAPLFGYFILFGMAVPSLLWTWTHRTSVCFSVSPSIVFLYRTRTHQTSLCLSISLCMAFTVLDSYTQDISVCLPFSLYGLRFWTPIRRTLICSFHTTLIRISSLGTQ